MKFCIIGAGSVNWMSRLVRDIYILDCIDDVELALYDIEPLRVRIVEKMCNTFNRQRKKNIRVKV